MNSFGGPLGVCHAIVVLIGIAGVGFLLEGFETGFFGVVVFGTELVIFLLLEKTPF